MKMFDQNKLIFNILKTDAWIIIGTTPTGVAKSLTDFSLKSVPITARVGYATACVTKILTPYLEKKQQSTLTEYILSQKGLDDTGTI